MTRRRKTGCEITGKARLRAEIVEAMQGLNRIGAVSDAEVEKAEALYREAAADGVREREAAEWDALPLEEELPKDKWSKARRKTKPRK